MKDTQDDWSVLVFILHCSTLHLEWPCFSPVIVHKEIDKANFYY
ncbi:hypothetical protein SLEP1_g42225 [Rubroshorea leprosula]|uniref:Uncharacterized protein n=1 Tax=Rubroshorea leprosula TaxID=152421 RepID=A0AAV5L9M6_9ROSI|nr:hypothetical protein SLEP1_g42225 [Rubroshorea leprosula]